MPARYDATIWDRAVPPIYQDMVFARVKEEGVELRIETFDARHSIFSTKQDEMAESVVRAAKDDRNEKSDVMWRQHKTGVKIDHHKNQNYYYW